MDIRLHQESGSNLDSRHSLPMPLERMYTKNRDDPIIGTRAAEGPKFYFIKLLHKFTIFTKTELIPVKITLEASIFQRL